MNGEGWRYREMKGKSLCKNFVLETEQNKKKIICVKNVTESFRKNFKSNQGEIVEKNRKLSKHERDMARWVIKKFGGEIHAVQVKRQEHIKTPDVIWDGMNLEIKKASGTSSIDNSIDKGTQQIGKKGIILLDISENRKNIEQIKNEVIHRVIRNHVKGSIKTIHAYIIFVKNNKLVGVIEIKKRR